MHQRSIRLGLTVFATFFAFIVVIAGAYTRITDAGLGCPDWPGCYHQLTVPSTPVALAKANALYPMAPVDQAKAAAEMGHRYIAGILGLLIALLGAWAWVHRKEENPAWPIAGPLILVVIFQAALGMWTVTLKLLPVVVMGHLVGGFTCLSLLAWLSLRLWRPSVGYFHASLYPYAVAAMVVLCIQILLGGWTSANYAALVCPDFPTCHGQLWVPFSTEAFHLLKGVGLEFPLSAMQYADRVTIQMVHRLGALITFITLMGLSVSLIMLHTKIHKRLGVLLMGLLVSQVLLGIANIALWLPVPIAVAHNGTAALLLMTMVFVLYTTHPAKKGQCR